MSTTASSGDAAGRRSSLLLALTLGLAGACSSGLDGLHVVESDLTGPGGSGDAGAAGVHGEDVHDGGGASALGGAAGEAGGGGAGGAGDTVGAGGASGGSAGAAGSGGSVPGCVRPFGFASDDVTWLPREGDDVGISKAELPFALGGASLSSWSLATSGAPSWVDVSFSTSGEVVDLAPVAPGVPFDAYPAPATFQISATRADDPGCVSTITVHLDVTNVLHALGQLDTAGGVLAGAYQPSHQRFVVLDPTLDGGRLLFIPADPANAWAVELAFPPTPGALAASDDHVYLLEGATVHRLDADGANDAPVALGAAPVTPTLAAAGGALLLADELGPTRILRDGSSLPEPTALPAHARHATSDGAEWLAFDVVGDSGSLDVWTAALPALTGASCAVPPGVGPPAIGGGRFGVLLTDAKGMYTRTSALGSCEVQVVTVPASPPFAIEDAMAITGDRAVTVTSLGDGGGQTVLRVDLVDLLHGAPLGLPLVNYPPKSAAKVHGIVAGGNRALVLVSSPVLLAL